MHPQTVYDISRDVQRELIEANLERRSIVSRVRRMAQAKRAARGGRTSGRPSAAFGVPGDL